MATLALGPLDRTSISKSKMHSDSQEEWENLSDDWFDNADEIVDRGKRMYLEMCLELPSVQNE